MRESFIFYKSFYESIKELDKEQQYNIYKAIMEHEFEDKKPNLTGIENAIFVLIEPQLKANKKRYENGCKGGAPKGNKNAKKTTKKQPKNNQKTTKKQPNDNENVNVNENDNDNENNITTTTTIYDFLQKNGFVLSPIHLEVVSEWEDNDLTRYAIKQAVLNNKYNINYIDKILYSYKKDNIKTVEQAIERAEDFNNKKEEYYKTKYKKKSDREQRIEEWLKDE